MSKENVIKFYDKVSRDIELKRKLDKLAADYDGEVLGASLKKFIIEEKIVPLAKKEGFDVNCDEVMEYLDKCAKKITSQQVKAVSGGSFTRGELVAAKVAKKSIVNSATQAANQLYQDMYKEKS